ncbi:hypothetical protein BBF96_12265 [Anoxybacter fermentans]|uniref:Uncharacterized protein n=1 Tax=Anoxybacter fermentans TaxID=1323375 RepID=A0A3S9T0H9_9FIRM|nr:tetratricopeptide repeat protein [Anoxybacter fermentans]AZR74103.1 hypothetical protein BBF96_12265 [Anoxybacter fermentans]
MKFIRKHKKIFILSVIIFIYVSYCLTLDSEEQFKKYTEKARNSIMAHNFSNAIRYWQKAIKYKPDDYETLRSLANFLYDIDYKKAKKYFQQLIKYHGDKKIRGVAEAYYYLGKIAFEEDDKEQAISYFKKAIEADPTYGKTYASLAIFFEGEKEIEIYKKGIKNAPDEVENYIKLFLSYYNEEKYDLSTISFEELRNLIPLENATGEILSRIGNLLYGMANNIETAIVVHKKALEKDDTIARSYRDLGGIYKLKGLYEKSEEYYKAAIQYEKDIENFSGLAHLYYILGEYKKTVETLLECLKYDDIDSGNTEYIMAMAYYKLGDYKNALYWLEQYDSRDEDIIKFQKYLQRKLNQ